MEEDAEPPFPVMSPEALEVRLRRLGKIMPEAQLQALKRLLQPIVLKLLYRQGDTADHADREEHETPA